MQDDIDEKDKDTAAPTQDLNFKDTEGLQLDNSPENEDGKQSLLQMLRNRLANNLSMSNKAIGDATNASVDRINMAANPDLQGPRLGSDDTLPQEKNLTNMMMNSVAGSVSPIAKSAPWMKNLTSDAIQSAIPKAEGLVNSTKENIYTEAAKAAQRFRNLQKILRSK